MFRSLVLCSCFMMQSVVPVFVKSWSHASRWRHVVGAREKYEYETHKIVDGTFEVDRGSKRFHLCYRIFSPSSEASQQKPPLLVLHGGPSLPSQYLYPMVPYLSSERSVIFFDQLGCGKSDEPRDIRMYSIAKTVDDIANLVKTLNLEQIHLLGHSYGGVLAFEYTKLYPTSVRSLVLSNAPTNMELAGDEYDRLFDLDPLLFWNTHVCRLPKNPPALEDALLHVGRVWGGMDAVMGYVAEPSSLKLPPTLVIQGQYDFGLNASLDWKEILLGGGNQNEKDSLVQVVRLENCAHYPHLEYGETYGKLIESFYSRHETNHE